MASPASSYETSVSPWSEDSPIPPGGYMPPTHDGFDNELRLRGVHSADNDDEYNVEFPDDWQELGRIARGSRESPYFDPEEYENYKMTVRDANSEMDVTAVLLPQILKMAWRRERYTSWMYRTSWISRVQLPLRGKEFGLSPPMPTLTMGWRPETFPDLLERRVNSALIKANDFDSFDSYASPAEDMFWPFVTVEAKGNWGEIRVARIENLNSASIMLNNQHELCKKARRVEFPYKRTMAITIIVTTETAEVHAHWVSKDGDGNVVFWGRCISSWDLLSPDAEVYILMKRSIRNLVEWVRARTLANIRQDLAALRKRVREEVAMESASFRGKRKASSDHDRDDEEETR